ncbi:MAG: two-component regulator propeller domain-containing protein [Segetibacter sp.]
MKYNHVNALFLMFVFCTSCKGQNKTEQPRSNIKPENKEVITSHPPNSITRTINSETKDVIASHGPSSLVRTIKQDRKGNIWIASWEGIFRYDGKSFTNITSKVSSARFFLFWKIEKEIFGSVLLAQVFIITMGNPFRNFTTKDGLAGDGVTTICEDKMGNIWFGTGGGVSRYDGKSFRNFTTKDGLADNNVNWIFQDKTGKFWFGTRGYASVYDGKIFTTITNKEGKAFKNVWCIIEDKKGNIWFGDDDGLWRYDGSTFSNFTQRGALSIIEDKKGNIWTSSEALMAKVGHFLVMMKNHCPIIRLL